MKKTPMIFPEILVKRCIFTVVSALFSMNLLAQTTFNRQWEKSFGGKGDDFLWDVKPTADGGVIMGGSSNSGMEGGKSQPNRNFYDDIWVIKLDAHGNKQWDKTIGGTYGDEIRKLQQTADGGYILFGESWSDISGDKSEPCKGRPDYWLVKLDAGGNKVWDRTYGGNSDEIPEEMEITPDGGFILVGKSDSGISGDKTDSTTFRDHWILKVDNKGNKVWDKSLGVKHPSEIRYFNQTAEKGFLFSGFYIPNLKTKSGQDATGHADFWLIKLDEKGKEVWNKHYGTDKYDVLMSVQLTTDGGYILGGNTESHEAGNKQADCLVIKIDSRGNKVWEKTFGTSLEERLRTVQQTPDKGYIVAGFTGQEVKENTDMYDSWQSKFYWVTKLDAEGNKTWEERFEIPKDKLGYLVQTPDKGFLITGTYSRKDESQSEDDVFNGDPPKRINETWVIKLDTRGKKQWSARIPRKEHHTFDTPELTKDSGFVLWGQEFPEHDESDYWIVKFGPEGMNAKTPGQAAETIYDKVDQMPVFPGNETALNAYFLKALADKTNLKGGTVTLKLVIDKTGHPKDIEVLNGLAKETDALVVEVARKMPKWQPGKLKGQPVNTRITLPVTVPLNAKTQATDKEESDDRVYSFVQQQPAFPGGNKAMEEFLDKNIRYPAQAKEKKIEGRVVLSFIVKTNGNIKDPVIMKGLSPEIDSEAIRLLNAMPAWIPGMQNGKKVNVRLTMPILFRINEQPETK